MSDGPHGMSDRGRQEHLPSHVITWDDQEAPNQQLAAGDMLRRLAGVLEAEFTERSFRDEPRYELRRIYPGGLELSILAGHIYDVRETLSMVVELRVAGASRPVASYHLSQGIERVKASDHTAWIRSTNGAVLIVGEGLSGIVEVQN